LAFVSGTTQVRSRVRVFCLYSTYLDTLFCNLTFLQTFFSSLDAYLRLRNPTFYLNSARRRPALWLKVGSPWLVAALQAIGQLTLSDREQVSLHVPTLTDDRDEHSWTSTQSLQTTCLLPDPNFLIIRTAIAYALPLIVCIILVGMQLRCLRQLRDYSYQSLQALLQVRSNVQNLCLTSRTSSRLNAYGDNIAHQSYSSPNALNSTVLRIPDTTSLNQLQSDNIRSPVSNRLTSSFHLDHQGTFETLLADANLSTTQLHRVDNPQTMFTSSTHISHVLLPTSTMPFFEIRPINTTNLTPDMIYTTTQSSIINCPAHGQVTVTVAEKPGQQPERRQNPTRSTQMPNSEDDVQIEESTNTTEREGVHSTSIQVDDTEQNQDEISVQQTGSETKPVESVVIASNGIKSIVKSSSAYSMPPLSTAPSTSRTASPSQQIGWKNRYSTSPLTNTHKNEDYISTATPLWLRAYKGEQLAVAINLVSCIIAVGTWSPFILSTLAHGLCQPLKFSLTNHPSRMRPVYTMHPALLNLPQNTNPPSRCMIQVTPERIADFRWWAYASAGLLLPCLLFFLDLGLREGCWRALRYPSRNEHRSDKDPTKKDDASQTPDKSLRATNTNQTYRCSNDSRFTRHIPSTDRKISSDPRLVEVIHLDELWNKRTERLSNNSPGIRDVQGSTSVS
ncbi:hypothetical protein FBUS_06723, partial [Fasciolopsis buskii]